MEMGWLLLLFIVDVKGGDLQPKTVTRQVFHSERECEREGGAAVRALGRPQGSQRSFTLCLPQSAFADEGLHSEALGGRK